MVEEQNERDGAEAQPVERDHDLWRRPWPPRKPKATKPKPLKPATPERVGFAW